MNGWGKHLEFRRWWQKAPPEESAIAADVEELARRVPVPAIWLLGKTGSGKSSVVRYLTGADAAVVGQGFKPETKHSTQFDFPDAEQPLVQFIDTRGIGEVGYDPSEDIARFNQHSQVVIVTARVRDHALGSIIEPLKQVRAAAPERPVILLLTCLHEVADCEQISASPYPFSIPMAGDNKSRVTAGTNFQVPVELSQLIDDKADLFAGLVDQIIPIDLTQADDNFANPDFGGTQLRAAILEHLPQAFRQAMLALRALSLGARDDRQRKVQRQVLASSAMAASAAAIPLPYLDIPAVFGIQAHLAYSIADLHEQKITASNWAVLGSAAGSRAVVRLLLREALKLVPAVGMAASAASAFAFTYALGMSWDWYFRRSAEGQVPSAEELKEKFAEQLSRGRELWNTDGDRSANSAPEGV